MLSPEKTKKKQIVEEIPAQKARNDASYMKSHTKKIITFWVFPLTKNNLSKLC